MNKIIKSFFFLYTSLYAQVLDEKELLKYFSTDNPNVYAVIGKNSIAQKKVDFAKGAFDLNLNANYEKKQYPNSDAEYEDFYFTKSFQNTLKMSTGYRYAKGVQEYNNIKTSGDGEFITNLKVPILEVINSIDKNTYSLQQSQYSYEQTKMQSSKKLLDLQLSLYEQYYKTLYFNELLELHSELFQRVKTREKFIAKRVEKGVLAKIELLDANEQRLAIEQRLEETKNSFEINLKNLCFLMNLDFKSFKEKYTLPKIPDIEFKEYDAKKVIESSLAKRDEIKILKNFNKALHLDKKYNRLLQYPKIDLDLYGVYDPLYKDGYKVKLNLNFPLYQTKYEAKSQEILKHQDLIKQKILLKEHKIKTVLQNLLLEKATLEKNLQTSYRQLQMLLEIESIEKKRYDLGVGDLFMLNQREIKTLNVKTKTIELKYRRVINLKRVERETSSFENEIAM